MNFDVKTVLQELKKLKDRPTAELVFDWSILHAYAHKLKKSKSKTKTKIKTEELPEFIKKKFGSVENFSKYATALYTELKRRGINVKLKDVLKDYIKVNEHSLMAVDLYMSASDLSRLEKLCVNVNDNNDNDDNSNDNGNDNDYDTNNELEPDIDLDGLPNYVLKRGFVRLVGSLVTRHKFGNSEFTRSPEESDVDIYVDMPAEEVPTWIHKKLHLMLSKVFGKPVQIIYQNPEINGPTEDAITLYDLVLVKRIEYEPAYIEEEIELSSPSKVSFKDLHIPRAYKAIYGLDNISAKDIPFENYVIQPKYNGMRIVVFDGGKKVYTDSGNKLSIDVSYVFTGKVPDNYVFIGEVWSDTLPRSTVIGKVKKGEMDKELTVTIYDVVYPEEDYRTQLQMIKKYVKPKYRVKNFSTLSDAIKFVEKHPEFDGIVIKNLDATPSDRQYMIKVKKEADVDVQVIKRLRNKNGTYKYEVGYLDGDELKSFGETFSTKQKFNKGDIIEVSCEEVTYYEDENIVKGYAMRVKGASNNTRPYTKKEIIKVAKSSGILNIVQKDD